MAGIPECVRRRRISDALRDRFEATIEQRVDRYIEASHQPITPNHHFAAASAECILLYTDRYFYSTVMVAQSVAEGISRFVAERNDVQFGKKMNGPQIVDLLIKRGIVTPEYAAAFTLLWKTRNDVHHMNPEVAKIDLPELAKTSIQNLDTIEREIFAGSWSNDGKFIPTKPKYWDIQRDGTTPAFLRLEP